ncbi:MAG: hypothetical protein JW715_15670 [Sedimentisphaerales bacterium]|nr:hypothetical protein [Sedimentisphaerales bacterium]
MNDLKERIIKKRQKFLNLIQILGTSSYSRIGLVFRNALILDIPAISEGILVEKGADINQGWNFSAICRRNKYLIITRKINPEKKGGRFGISVLKKRFLGFVKDSINICCKISFIT